MWFDTQQEWFDEWDQNGNSDRYKELQSWLGTHVARSIADDNNWTLEMARDQFHDAPEGVKSSQYLVGDLVVYTTVEWVFPLEVERHWEWSTLFYAENAFPAGILMPPRTEGRMTISFDDVSYFINMGASQFHGFTDQDLLVGLVEGVVADKLGSAHDNVLTGTVRQVIRSRSQSMPAVEFPHVKYADIDSIRINYLVQGNKEESTVHALAEYGGHPISTVNLLPLEQLLQPTELRAVMYDDPLQDWIDVILTDLGPDKLLISPRQRVMDEAWGLLWLDTPGDPWNTYLAAHDSNVELVETPVTDESGVEVHESVTWPTSTGVAGYLVFNPAFPADLDPDWFDIHPPASYDLAGELGYSGTDPWDLPLEDPAHYKGWEPGLP